MSDVKPKPDRNGLIASGPSSDDAFQNDANEEQSELRERRKKCHYRVLVGGRAMQLPTSPKQVGAANDSGETVKPSKPDKERHKRNHTKRGRDEDNDEAPGRRRHCQRQHWDIRTAIVVASRGGQRPEMRHRPQEHHECESGRNKIWRRVDHCRAG